MFDHLTKIEGSARDAMGQPVHIDPQPRKQAFGSLHLALFMAAAMIAILILINFL